jgi:glycosyltransferase involved in cell wall biosynthesis
LIVIVQNKPTQFDAPLYAYLWSRGWLGLRVYYTCARQEGGAEVDPEVGQAPQWDHLSGGAREVVWAAGYSAAGLAREIAALDPDLVVISGYYPAVHAQLALLLKLRGIRIGLRSDNTLRHSSFAGAKGLLKRIVFPLLLRMYDSWHPVGSLARQYLEATSGASRPTYLFPYNVDNDWFASRSATCRADRASRRAAMGFAEDDFVVIGVMKWNEREDPLTLVEAFHVLHGLHPKARLLLVGDGPLRDEVRARLAGLESVVRLPGYVAYSELPCLYAVSDVFVHTAPGEPWGVSVNEAMACGLPVVAAEGVGAGADLIEEGVTGFVFADRDSSTLAEALGRMQAHPGLTERMGRQAVGRMASWNYAQTEREMCAALGIDAAAALPG